MNLSAIVLSAILGAGQEAAGIDPKQVECVAKAVYHEARGEPEAGQIAVADVVVSRAAHGRYRPTPCRVIRQPGQFRWAKWRLPICEPKAFVRAPEIAVRVMLAGGSGATHFYAPAVVSPSWSASLVEIAQVGGHRIMAERSR